ncbi:NAD(+) diphosphatase [uncultured Microbacterium sp.]|uniref:NAD(+) diphosphatase n=1 Tax=uncultured Microbacterium sp. TaxID=191216 RepID=UPI0025F504B9|nr:NAD(+) diphosphatase [uncultured Microbacterium sp.]
MPLPASSSSAGRPSLHVDRSGIERDDADLLARVFAEPTTRVLAIRRDAAPLIDGRLALLPVSRFLPDAIIPGAAAVRGAEPAPDATTPGVSVAPAPDATTPAAPTVREDDPIPAVREWAFLGRADDGAAILLAVLADDAGGEASSSPRALAPDATWTGLRATGGDLPEGEAELLTTAVALAGWLRDAPFCPACGARTRVEHAGWSRRCPVCGREHFPRTDPAVIVLVTSADGDRVLLGVNAAWGGARYSCFAGFAEAGESLEDAVEREVNEESNVHLRRVEYRGSQAWPYPRSLMLGFRAEVVDEEAARADGEEIVEVRWFTRDEVGAALRGEAAVQLPGAASIAHRLIDEWYRRIA